MLDRSTLTLLVILAGCEPEPVRLVPLAVVGRALDVSGNPITSGTIMGSTAAPDGHGAFNSTSAQTLGPDGRFSLTFQVPPMHKGRRIITLCWSGEIVPADPNGRGSAMFAKPPSRGSGRAELTSDDGGHADVEDVTIQPRPGMSAGASTEDSLGPLTIRRRGEKLADPLAVFVMPDSKLKVQFPEQPTIHVNIANVDDRGERFQMLLGCDSRGPRLDRWSFEVDVGSLHLDTFYAASFGGIGINATLEPGHGDSYVLPSRQYLQPFIGRGRMAISYVAGKSSKPDGSDEQSVRVRTHFFDVEVDLPTVHVKQADRARVASLLHELDASAPFMLVMPPCVNVTSWRDPPQDTAQALLREGWIGFALLLSQIDDPSISHGEVCWRLALLYDYSGLLDPRLAIGKSTSRFLNLDEHGAAWLGSASPVSDFTEGDAEALVRRWALMRNAVTIVDD